MFIKLRNRINNNYLIAFIISILISLVLEIFIFNFRYFESLFFKNEFTMEITNLKNIEKIGNNKYKLLDSSNYIEINNINKHLCNLFLNIDSADDYVSYNIFATDSGNSIYYKLPQRTITNQIEQSKYIKLNFKGKSKKIKIKFNFNKEEDAKNIITINNIKANVLRHLNFCIIRFIMITLLLFISYLIRPSSPLYQYKLLANNKKAKKFNFISIGAFIIFHFVLFWFLTNLNNFFINPTVENQIQYNKLTESLNNNQFNIDYKVGKSLKNLKNPYDTIKREKTLAANDEEYLWDYAYYNGKYYVYFGIIPVIIGYYPVYKLINIQLKNSVYIFVLLCLITIIILKLIKFLIKKYFPKVSTIHYLLICFLFINCSYFLYAAKRPDFYTVPIITAVFFSILGIYLWLSSLNENRINLIKLFFGSLYMALVAGCRPQLIFGSFLSIIIFKNYFKNNKRIKDIITFIIPYILIAGILMYYNYIRFNSPFDFGANYNLTTNDMTVRGFDFDRIFLGIFYTLFSSINITPIFPFIKPIAIETQYMGITISEPLFGGIIRYNLILLLGIISFKFKKIINNKTLYNLSICCNIIAIIIIIIDVEVAGILPRYILDFSWLLFISTSIVILSIFNDIETRNNKIKKHIYTGFLILFLFSISYNYMLIPNDISYSISKYEPVKFQKLAYLFQFWL